MIEITNEPLEYWLSDLEPNQRESILKSVKENGEEQAAIIWLNDNKPSIVKSLEEERCKKSLKEECHDKSLEVDINFIFDNLWSQIKKEFNSFVCKEGSFDKLGSALVSTISIAIGACLGIAIVIITPLVAILLSIVASVGINAYCENKK